MSLFKRIKAAPSALLGILHYLSRGLALTQRVTVHDPADRLAPDAEGPVIYALWHNRLFMMPLLMPKHYCRRLHFLASQSRDGGYIADYLSRLDMQPIRGSSSRGGAKALVEMRRILRRNDYVAITPDGPRGPRYQVQDGIIWLAAKTGAPIVPISYNPHRYWEAKSWDRTQIPKPMSRGNLILAPALTISEEELKEDFERARRRVRHALLEITEDCRDRPDKADPTPSETSRKSSGQD